MTGKAGLIADRLGAGRVRRRLRQRRLRRSVRDVLGTEPPVSQSRRRHLRRRDAWPRGSRPRSAAGAPGAPSSTTIATAASICSPPTTSTSISTRRRCPSRACAATRAFPSRADRRGCPAARTCSIATRATARSTTSPIAPASPRPAGTYGLGVSTLDFDDDGWVDLYVANDSNPSALYRNNRDGTFTDIAVEAGCAYSQDGKPQAGMGVAVGDYDRDGTSRHLQDQLRRRHVDAVRQRRARACARTGRSRPASA